jgi:hypothetical protein
MIDFNTSQLTWIVIGACSVGGTGYMTMNDNVMGIDTKVQVTQQKVMDVDDKVAELQKQLTRMEDKLDKRGSR